MEASCHFTAENTCVETPGRQWTWVWLTCWSRGRGAVFTASCMLQFGGTEFLCCSQWLTSLVDNLTNCRVPLSSRHCLSSDHRARLTGYWRLRGLGVGYVFPTYLRMTASARTWFCPWRTKSYGSVHKVGKTVWKIKMNKLSAQIVGMKAN